MRHKFTSNAIWALRQQIGALPLGGTIVYEAGSLRPSKAWLCVCYPEKSDGHRIATKNYEGRFFILKVRV
jgi:hypothetical protein